MEEDIKILEQFLVGNKYCEGCEEKCVDCYIEYEEVQAVANLLTRYKQLEQKLMYALTPTTHELALETQRNFKKIIAQNIDEDTYTIKRELKKYWDNMNTYWKEK